MAAYRELTCLEEVEDARDEIVFLQEAFMGSRVTGWLLQGVVEEFLRDPWVEHLPDVWAQAFRGLLAKERSLFLDKSYFGTPIHDALRVASDELGFGRAYLSNDFAVELSDSWMRSE